MATVAAKSKSKSASAAPPEEQFWKRYSPHYELPLAGMTSLFMHGLVLTFLVLGGIAFLFRSRDEASRPPAIDVVMMSSAGTGTPGPEGASGTPGQGDAERSEAATPYAPEQRQMRMDQAPTPALSEVPKIELDFPQPKVEKADNDVGRDLEAITADAEKRAKTGETAKPTPTPPRPAKLANVGPPGKGAGPPGSGGIDNKGTGPGTGNQGTGTGGGGPAGVPATQAQIFAERWNFDLSGNPRQHADKLAAIGFVVAIPDPTTPGRFLEVVNLRRRPVELKPVPASKFESAVKKGNTKQDSVAALARELKMRITPSMVIIMIPDGLKQKMANEEMRYAEKMGRNLAKVNNTWFDFRLENGNFEPFVARMD